MSGSSFPDERRRLIAQRLRQHGSVSVSGLEAEVKRAMIARAREAILLVDASKFDRSALAQIGDVSQVRVILVADAPDAALRPFERAGVDIRHV
jgi:DeoR/GlpR family transcriptional regulator of sugar metabolism